MHSRSKQSSGGGRGSNQKVVVTKSVARKTTSIDDTIVALRRAVFNDDGSDKDVCEKLKPFMKYDRNGLDIEIKFTPKLHKKERKWAFDLIKENMEDRYDASGYGWDDEDKMRELSEDGARFLVARVADNAESLDQGELVACAHFRFSVQGDFMDKMEGESALIVHDLHVEEEFQNKGLGKHLMTILELVAKREGMSRIYFPVQLEDDEALEWVEHAHVPRGYGPDETLKELLSFDAEMEGFEPYCKLLTGAPPAKKQTEAAPATVFAAPEEAVSSAAEEAAGMTDAEVADKMQVLKQLYQQKFDKEPTADELNEWVLQMAGNLGDEAPEDTQA